MKATRTEAPPGSVREQVEVALEVLPKSYRSLLKKAFCDGLKFRDKDGKPDVPCMRLTVEIGGYLIQKTETTHKGIIQVLVPGLIEKPKNSGLADDSE